MDDAHCLYSAYGNFEYFILRAWCLPVLIYVSCLLRAVPAVLLSLTGDLVLQSSWDQNRPGYTSGGPIPPSPRLTGSAILTLNLIYAVSLFSDKPQSDSHSRLYVLGTGKIKSFDSRSQQL